MRHAGGAGLQFDLVAALTLVASAGGAPSSPQVASARNVTMETTFYGARDNCPPGGAIAYPLLHPVAGGTGTFADPITFAGSKKALPKHTRVYVVELQKYFIMEDDCGECDDDWTHKQKYHIDLWIGSDKLGEGPPLIACENALTSPHRVVTVDPPDHLPVNSTPLYTVANGCILPNPPRCHDTGSACGNGCDTPSAASCTDLAKEFHLTLARFKVLNNGKHGNPEVNCSAIVPKGTNVCMGGSCGD
jgi:hypothetical protein